MEWLFKIIIFIVVAVLIALTLNLKFHIRTFSSFIAGMLLSIICVGIWSYMFWRNDEMDVGFEVSLIMTILLATLYMTTRIIRDKY